MVYSLLLCYTQIVLIWKLQEYIHVLSRPMAAAKARRNIWTNVYLHNMVWSFSTVCSVYYQSKDYVNFLPWFVYWFTHLVHTGGSWKKFLHLMLYGGARSFHVNDAKQWCHDVTRPSQYMYTVGRTRGDRLNCLDATRGAEFCWSSEPSIPRVSLNWIENLPVKSILTFIWEEFGASAIS